MKKQYYFDYASTTPTDPKVVSEMLPYFDKYFGNSGSLHKLGRISENTIKKSIEKITKILDCKKEEIIFTGSATESDNLAILGIARANKERGNRILVSKIEHKAVLSACQKLKKEGFEIIEIPVRENGLVDIEKLKKFLTPKTILISVTSADNETGTIQPIAEISRIIKNFRRTFSSQPSTQNPLPYLHTDASQAFGYLDTNPKKIGVDAMTISSHKIYGPKGIGLLFVKQGTNIEPIIYGGGQKMRPGTENTPLIVGFTKALELNQKNKKKESIRIGKIRNLFEEEIFKSIPKTILNGHKTKRLPNFLNISFLDVEGEALLLYLDELDIMASTGSACNSQSLEPSYILTALGNPYEYIHGSIRFSLGKYSSTKDVKYVMRHLKEAIKKLRDMSPLKLNLKQKENISDPKIFVGNQTPHFIKNSKLNLSAHIGNKNVK